MTIDHITSPTSQAASGTNNFSVPTSSGNLQVAAVVVDSGIYVSSVTDNAGNVYTIAGTSGGASASSIIAYCLQAHSGASSVTVGSSGSGGISITSYDISTTYGGSPIGTPTEGSGTSANPVLTADSSSGESSFNLAVLADSSAISSVAGGFTLEAMNTSSLSVNAVNAYNTLSNYIAYFTAASGTWNGVIIRLIDGVNLTATQIGYFLVGF